MKGIEILESDNRYGDQESWNQENNIKAQNQCHSKIKPKEKHYLDPCFDHFNSYTKRKKQNLKEFKHVIVICKLRLEFGTRVQI